MDKKCAWLRQLFGRKRQPARLLDTSPTQPSPHMPAQESKGISGETTYNLSQLHLPREGKSYSANADT